MKYTSERYIPNAKDVDRWHLRRSHQEHINRYHFAQEFVKRKVVLDVSCGTGYGSYELAKVAKRVIGIDIDPETIEYAKRHYKKSNLSFVASDAIDLPFSSNYFDIVVSFETIEHIQEPELFVAQIDKVLKSTGLFLGSTPRKLNEPRSEFHLTELSQKQLLALLKKYFSDIVLLGQENVYCSLIKGVGIKQGIQEIDKIYAVNNISLRDTLVFVCSKKQGSVIIPSILDIDISGYVEMLEEEVKRLDGEIKYRDEIIEIMNKEIENMKVSNFIRRQLKKFKIW